MTREIGCILPQDNQLGNGFELMTEPRWPIKDPDYWSLLHAFERRLPLRPAPYLRQSGLAAHGSLARVT